MTAFARHIIQNKWGSAAWEIRSVNQRYLEINIILPEQFSELKEIIYKNIKTHLTRGRIECILQSNMDLDNVNILDINKKMLNQLTCIIKKIKKKNGEGEIDIIKILNWPGILIKKKKNLNNNNIQSELLKCFHSVLGDFINNRKREGAAIKEIIEQKLSIIKIELNNIKDKIPTILIEKRKQLLKKIEEIKFHVDVNRTEQELFIFAQKSDISEEIDLLNLYLKETENILKKEKGAIGRKLDFMMQELNRETNTVTSKSSNIYITKSAIEIKTLIEQIREQAQNIE
ncbi:YicC/YloC family endoribonuclease [Blochmannia endosymbiont of Colobopsis nipponica]|uniref:YicC/YloC family endoribonuclease n=1 Tax=Blochmannia endosymbiont of Colobopsis nipponica TaxID=2681987 RepID=UPI0021F1A19D|nr:YicC/YloC family endoribonuclease [Blochmannia endosymbiont of Colobopsis nipponica]